MTLRRPIRQNDPEYQGQRRKVVRVRSAEGSNTASVTSVTSSATSVTNAPNVGRVDVEHLEGRISAITGTMDGPFGGLGILGGRQGRLDGFARPRVHRPCHESALVHGVERGGTVAQGREIDKLHLERPGQNLHGVGRNCQKYQQQHWEQWNRRIYSATHDLLC